MNTRATPPVTAGYAPTAKALHWLIVALVLSQFVVSALMPDIGPHAEPGTLVDLHFSLGLSILALMALRLAHRLLHPVPPEAAEAPAWERGVAKATHAIFYFVLLVGPFLGWASASSHRLPVTFFGLFTLPALAAPRTRWANTAGDIHTFAMWTLLAIITLHAAAALYHHFVRHDTVLRRMLPGRAGV
ncbi:MAG: cytochrome b [Ramlibacter sp.]